MNFARLPTEPEARPSAAGGPHSRRNFWQPKAAITPIILLEDAKTGSTPRGAEPVRSL